MEAAVDAAPAAGYRCCDIMTPGGTLLDTRAMGDAVVDGIRNE